MIKDYFGFEIKVGDRLVRPVVIGSSAPGLERRTVTDIKNGKMYLDNSKVPIQFPERCINISHLRAGMV